MNLIVDAIQFDGEILNDLDLYPDVELKGIYQIGLSKVCIVRLPHETVNGKNLKVLYANDWLIRTADETYITLSHEQFMEQYPDL